MLSPQALADFRTSAAEYRVLELGTDVRFADLGRPEKNGGKNELLHSSSRSKW